MAANRPITDIGRSFESNLLGAETNPAATQLNTNPFIDSPDSEQDSYGQLYGDSYGTTKAAWQRGFDALTEAVTGKKPKNRISYGDEEEDDSLEKANPFADRGESLYSKKNSAVGPLLKQFDQLTLMQTANQGAHIQAVEDYFNGAQQIKSHKGLAAAKPLDYRTKGEGSKDIQKLFLKSLLRKAGLFNIRAYLDHQSTESMAEEMHQSLSLYQDLYSYAPELYKHGADGKPIKVKAKVLDNENFNIKELSGQLGLVRGAIKLDANDKVDIDSVPEEAKDFLKALNPELKNDSDIVDYLSSKKFVITTSQRISKPKEAGSSEYVFEDVPQKSFYMHKLVNQIVDDIVNSEKDYQIEKATLRSKRSSDFADLKAKKDRLVKASAKHGLGLYKTESNYLPLDIDGTGNNRDLTSQLDSFFKNLQLYVNDSHSGRIFIIDHHKKKVDSEMNKIKNLANPMKPAGLYSRSL